MSRVETGNFSNLDPELQRTFESKVVAPRNPTLIKSKNDLKETITPSQYISSMMLNTEERLNATRHMKLPTIIELLDMSQTTHQTVSHVDIDEAIFQPFPSELIFQNFKPFQTYQIPLELRNNDKVPRMVKVTDNTSPYFSIKSPDDVSKKVAPGMSSTFYIHFTPDAIKDYSHQLICTSERERILVPIKCIGARGLLDFPDLISLEDCPVKMSKSKTLLIRNIGTVAAKFSLYSTDGAFEALPSNGELKSQEAMQITIQFKPRFYGDHGAELIISYDTGEEISVALQGSGINLDVKLSKTSVDIPPTFMGMANFKTFNINNRGNEIVRFKFTSHSTEDEENHFRKGLCGNIYDDEIEQRKTLLEEVADDPTLHDKLTILTRSYQNEHVRVHNDDLIFHESVLEISPPFGEIYPGRSVEISAIYKPDRIGDFEKLIYCDVQGREQRLPITIKGNGIGPILSFSHDAIDIGKIFVGSHHTYEVILSNRGQIDGFFSFNESITPFGRQFEFSPTDGLVTSSSHQLIQICFSSDLLGSFEEEFQFSVDGSDKKLELLIKGEVIGPTFRFQPSSIDFGTVSLGFEHQKGCKIINTSLVPMEFELEIQDNQTLDQAKFIMEPKSGHLEPESEKEIKLYFKADRDTSYNLGMAVNVPGIGQSVINVPVVAKCKIPNIILDSSQIDLGSIYLDYPINTIITLRNESKTLKAVYELLTENDFPQLTITSDKPSGIIEPGEILDLPLEIKAKGLEKLYQTAKVHINGQYDPFICQIEAIGKGPEVIANPTNIEWGHIPVLENLTKQIQLTNTALIPATFHCVFIKANTVWSINPESSEIPPSSSIMIDITVNVNDCVHFCDQLIITIDNGNRIEVDLSVTGVGTTIVSEPSMNPLPKKGIDLGPLFSTQRTSQKIRLINKGRRHQQLTWSVALFDKKSQRAINESRRFKKLLDSRDIRFKGLQPPPNPPKNVFSITPSSIELKPNEEVSVVLEGYCQEPGFIKETLLCHAIIGKAKGKERIMQVPIQCLFINPLIECSTRRLHFQINKTPNDTLKIEQNSVNLKNVSSLPLRMELRTVYPFAVDTRNTRKTTVILNPGEDRDVNVLFDPNYRTDYLSRQLDDALTIDYLDHPSFDTILLTSEINFPNLEFSQSEINFGSILNNTESAVNIQIRNRGPLPVTYRWWFELDDNGIGFDRPPSIKSVPLSEYTLDSNHHLSMLQVPQYESDSDEEITMFVGQTPSGSEASYIDSNQETGIRTGSSMKPPCNLEDIYDILPLYGRVEPGQSISTKFSFFGHPYVNATCRAVCDVDGGPQYETTINGQSSIIQFEFSETTLFLDKTPFDRLAQRDIILHNKGSIEFDFCADETVLPTTENIMPGQICVWPNKGTVPANSAVTLKMCYLPGTPEKFCTTFCITVAHFQPTKLMVAGEGVFPRISLDLPHSTDTDDYRKILELVQNQMANDEASLSSLNIELEAERLIMVESARAAAPNTILRQNKASRFGLPDYLLDFGPVILGQVRTHVVRATNTGHMPVSFSIDHENIFQSGFFCELDRVKLLPGFPKHESVDFKFTFDPAGENCELGIHEIRVPINIQEGPVIILRARAEVTMPNMTVSNDKLEFGSVECGKCKITTVQLFNPLDVDVIWKYEKPFDKRNIIDKHLPLHLRRKIRKSQKPLPMVFDIVPNDGILRPKERRNVEIKFMPNSDEYFHEKMVLTILESIQKVIIEVSGTGIDQHINVSHNLLNMGPILPMASGCTVDITVNNPGDLPIEMYSLEFDDKYLDDEKILRDQKGFDSFGNLLLPPREVGESLPDELLLEHRLENETETENVETTSIDSHDPVQRSIARYLGIDLSPEGRAARNRQGIAVIVAGGPFSGKTMISKQIAQFYGAAMLTVDSIIMDSISNGNSNSAKKVRSIYDQCLFEQNAQAEIISNISDHSNVHLNSSLNNSDKSKKGSDKVSDSTRKLSEVPGSDQSGSKDPTATKSSNRSHLSKTNSNSAPRGSSQKDTRSSHTSNNFSQRSLTDDSAEPTFCCVLPEELLIELLEERLQQGDCKHGIVFDGLDSCFAANQQNTVLAILKAINNRKYLYYFDTRLTHEAYRQRLLDQAAAKEKMESDQRIEEERQIHEMSEDEYNSLAVEEQIRIDKIRISKRKEKYLFEKRQADERRREAEKMAEDINKDEKPQKKGKSKKGDEVSGRKSATTKIAGTDEGSVPTVGSNEVNKTKKGRSKSLTRPSPDGDLSPFEKALMEKFKTTTENIPNIEHILKYWNRKELRLIRPLNVDSDSKAAEPTVQEKKKEQKKGKKDVKKTAEETEMEEERLRIELENELKKEEVGIPVWIRADKQTPPAFMEYSEFLPTYEEILDALGLGSNGPPIPDPVEFSIISFPNDRTVENDTHDFQYFNFVAYGTDDPNIAEEDRLADEEAERTNLEDELKQATAAAKKTKKRGKSAKGKTAAKPETPPGGHTEKVLHLAKYRWVIQPKQSTKIRVRFVSDKLGEIKKTLTFELLGNKKQYQIECHGVCAFPTISPDPAILFPKCRNSNPTKDEIVLKRFIIPQKVYQFGPLLIGKTRDKIKINKHPENIEKITILNDGRFTCEINFSFKKDTTNACFSLEPPKMSISPGGRKELIVWAFPKQPGIYQDSVICSIRDNPDPFLIDIHCTGIKPEIQVDRKIMQFEKVLLHRRTSQSLQLHNPTALPVAWRVAGMENMGDEFSLNSEFGVIEPFKTFNMIMDFRALKAMSIKRNIRIEVGDVDNVLGVCKTESVQVIGEAYDVALDMSFPRGADGGLDFGIVRVFDESKQTCSLKNKGKYEIAFKFTLESSQGKQFGESLEELFKIMPSHGTLMPIDRPTQVQVQFNARSEVQMSEMPILKCHVIEPNMSETGETIASIPIKVTARSVFSKYTIVPTADINFGPMLVSTKRTKSFVIENKGEFDFRYSICKLIRALSPVVKQRKPHKLISRDGSASSRSQMDRTNFRQQLPGGFREQPNQTRLLHGPFVIYPGFGTIQPGQSVTVVIDCAIEHVKRHEEFLAIEISDRDPDDNPGGIPYKLLAEGCMPTIDVLDVNQIFEEQRIVQTTSGFPSFSGESGLFGIDENRFIFPNVIVGRRASARFKILNPQKLPCDINIQVKPINNKIASKIQDVFDVDPIRSQIGPHGFVFVTIFFAPKAIQEYDCVFEASVESTLKCKSLTFSVHGEGSLPRVQILHPSLKNAIGHGILNFRRLVTGRRESLPLVLKNTGNLPARIDLDLEDVENFEISSVKGKGEVIITNRSEPELAHSATTHLDAGQEAHFMISFCAHAEGVYKSAVRIAVIDNEFENVRCILNAEAYKDSVSLENLPPLPFHLQGLSEISTIFFGDLAVGEECIKSFVIQNKQPINSVRFAWGDSSYIKFSPQIGHLHPGATKTVQISIQSESAIQSNEEIKCNIFKISYPEDEVEWDDRVKNVRFDDFDVLGRQIKKKIYETEPEPNHTVIDELHPICLNVQGNIDYAKAEISTEILHFPKTDIYSSNKIEFSIKNIGKVELNYLWDIFEPVGVPSSAQRSVLKTALPFSVSEHPFIIEPKQGRLLAGQSKLFTATFCPTDMRNLEMAAACRIPNWQADIEPIQIKLIGKGILPALHLSLPESGTPHENTHDISLTQTKVSDYHIRILPIGMGIKTISSIWVLNPTSETYNWKLFHQSDQKDETYNSFRCLTPRGRLEPGRKQLIKMEFISDSTQIILSNWIFSTDSAQYSLKFEGQANDPDLLIDCPTYPNLTFPNLITGQKYQKCINVINNDKIPHEIVVQDDSKEIASVGWKLNVSPSAALIPPQDKLQLEVNIEAMKPGELSHSIKIRCRGRKISKPKADSMTLMVKAAAHEMIVELNMEDPNGRKIELTNDITNIIDFGDVEIHEKSVRILNVVNISDTPVEYNWMFKNTENVIQISPESGVVPPHKRARCALSYQPNQLGRLSRTMLQMKISHGDIYNIELTGNSISPGVHFSFMKHDFGATFIHQPGMPLVIKDLEIVNRDRKEISIDCKFVPKPWLEFEFEPVVLKPGLIANCGFNFKPQQARQYSEVVEFIVNGLSSYKIELTGLGAEMRIALKKTYPLGELKLGTLRVGQTVTKKIPIINRSAAEATFRMSVTPAQTALQEAGILTISPSSQMTLQAKESSEIEISFNPKSRISPFREDIMLECLGSSRHFLSITGACHAISVELDQDAIPFGSVTHKSSCERRVVISNNGDIGIQFEWDVKSLEPDFSIEPAIGYLTPGNSCPLNITFHPRMVSQDIRYPRVECKIENSESIYLTLTGSCINVNQGKEPPTLFQCVVRGKDVKYIILKNPTNQKWCLKPVIDGPNFMWWSGPDKVIIDAQASKQVEFIYRPLTMTLNGRKHQGSVFFPLPDGTGLYHQLIGTAEPPKQIVLPIREVPCKSKFTEILQITNWLKRKQRFRVQVDMVKPDKLDAATTLKGLDYLDIPATERRDYKLHFYAHKEGVFSAKIFFRNESTSEYIVYQVQFKAIPPTTIDTINLITPVRRSVSHSIKIENPLMYAVTFQSECKLNDINVPLTFTVPPNAEGSLSFEYQPLKQGEASGKLIFHNPDLGNYQYDLNLTALPAKPEKPTYFQAPLGSNQIVQIRFTNYAKQKTEYFCKIKSKEFTTEKSISTAQAAGNGAEITLDIHYEPINLGTQETMLTLSSVSGGEYIFPLISFCSPPKPQGPYTIRAKSQIAVPFKNIFLEPVEFKTLIDNTLFTVRFCDVIKSKKTQFISVVFDGNPSGALVTGKLTVTAPKTLPGISWVFYLRGLTEKNNTGQ